MLAGGMIVVVAPGLVMYCVTVATLGVGSTNSWTELLMVTAKVVRVCAVMRAGAPSAKPRRDIVKNILRKVCDRCETMQCV